MTLKLPLKKSLGEFWPGNLFQHSWRQCFLVLRTVLDTEQTKFLMLLLLPSVSELNTWSMLLLAVTV